MTETTPDPFIDRVATKGDWFIEVDKHARKRRRTHYYNAGSNVPVCGEKPIDLDNAARAVHRAPNLVHVHLTEAREDNAGNPVTWGVACTFCFSIVMRGIDLKANHARRYHSLPVPTPSTTHTPPYDFPEE